MKQITAVEVFFFFEQFIVLNSQAALKILKSKILSQF